MYEFASEKEAMAHAKTGYEVLEQTYDGEYLTAQIIYPARGGVVSKLSHCPQWCTKIDM